MVTQLVASSWEFLNFNFPVEFFPNCKNNKIIAGQFGAQIHLSSTSKINSVVSNFKFDITESTPDELTYCFSLADNEGVQAKNISISYSTEDIGQP